MKELYQFFIATTIISFVLIFGISLLLASPLSIVEMMICSFLVSSFLIIRNLVQESKSLH